jgi:tRNA nucleotidyltransferase (CCA-adding enzyme)
VDGKTLSKAMAIQPGPWMKSALDIVIGWQLVNPDVDSVEAALSEVNLQIKSEYKDETPRLGKKGGLTIALINGFLNVTLRVIFTQKRHPDLTEKGRRNINATIEGRSRAAFDEEPKPWKSNPWAVELLSWVCRHLEPGMPEKVWGELIPPVLALLDDVDAVTKAQGCVCLGYILKNTGTDMLNRTGLIPVFEESLYAAASMLPTLTPQDDSVVLINAAYPALLALANAAHPKPTKDSGASDAVRNKFLRKILRQGFLAGFNHAGEHVLVAKALLDQLPPILDNMGVDSVIQLKDMVPLLSSILDDPFATASTPLLLSALRAEKAVVRNAWPRVWNWRGDLLGGLCGLWMRMAEEEEEGNEQEAFEDLRKECREVAEKVNFAVRWSEMRQDWPSELSGLIETEPALAELLEPLITGG